MKDRSTSVGFLIVAALLIAIGTPRPASADPTTLAISGGAATVTSSAPTTLEFPVTRSGDLRFGAFLQYETQDGTAEAGLDYFPATGSIVIPPGSSSASIPVTILGSKTNSSDKTFQVLLLGGGGGSFTPSFASQQAFATGNGPGSAVLADVNGDGKPDLIVANAADDTVSVLLNTTAPGATAPSFAAQQTFVTGGRPVSVALADVNSDGRPDLIVANAGGNTVSVLLNTTVPGATVPSFAAQQTFAAGVSPISVAAADVNGDGLADLIVANAGDNTVSVLLNTTPPGASTASFASEQVFAAGSTPSSLAMADVNGDGKPDVIVSGSANNAVSVLLNNTAAGSSTVAFAAQRNFAVGAAPSCVTAADLNGDGKPDLVVTNESDNTVSVLLNSTPSGAGTPSFAPQQTFATETTPVWVTALDVNNDGKPDLIVADKDSNNLSVLLNTTAPGASEPSFSAEQAFAAGTGPSSAVAADVNGDGRPDLVVTNSGDGTVSVLLDTTMPPGVPLGSSSFSPQQVFPVGRTNESVTVADMNLDGRPDLITTDAVDNNVSVLLNTTAPGAETPSFAQPQTFTAGSQPIVAAAADINGDGKPDLVVANQQGSNVSVMLNTTPVGSSTLGFAAQQTFATADRPSALAIADINSDGRPDIITANAYTAADLYAHTVSVLLNTTPPGAAIPQFTAQEAFATGNSPLSVAVADLNGDGRPDLVVANWRDNTLSVLVNTTPPGATVPQFAPQQTFAVGNGPTSVVAADINGDGKPDLIAANQTDSTVSVLLNTTPTGAMTASFTAQSTFAVEQTPGFVTSADINGDGRPDLIVANSNVDQQTPGKLSILVNNTPPGATSPEFLTQQTYDTGDQPLMLAVSDLNGDGSPDLIASNFQDATLSVLLNALYQTNTSGSPAMGTIHYQVPPPPVLGYRPRVLRFPREIFLGSNSESSVARFVTLINPKGNRRHPGAPVTIENFASSGDFSLDQANATTPCTKGEVLAPGEGCKIAVVFAPTSAGALSGTLTVSTDAANSPQIPLAGVGAQGRLVYRPRTLNFGTVPVGTIGRQARTLTLINPNPVDMDISVGAPSGNSFGQESSTCGTSLPAKQRCELTYTFTPPTKGPLSATVTITDDAAGGTQTVNLVGVGK